MAIVREHHENRTRNSTNDGRQHHQQNLLTGLKRGIKAVHSVGVQKRHHSEDDDGKEGVDKVTKTQLIFRQVHRTRVGGGPKPFGSHNSIVSLPIAAFVAVGEAREGA